MKKIAIFGAGRKGRKAILKYGQKNISFILDNNKKLIGTRVDSIPVKNIHDIMDDIDNVHIVIACTQSEEIADQLDRLGITDYEIYATNAYFDIPELIYNPYENSYKQNDSEKIPELNREIRNIDTTKSLFNHIEIETINRCNGRCSFCPVSAGHDTREKHIMSDSLFNRIIDDLARHDYNGKIALFSNNEPLLDDNIIERHRYAREHLPKARMHLCTNGTLLTIDIFTKLMQYLDELMIDNYSDTLELISPVQKIADYCKDNKDMQRRVTIILRKQQEVLTSRGGDSPNVIKEERYPDAGCMLPFKQMIVRPDGKVSLCCNDALGKMTLGDLNIESLDQVWFGEKFQNVRNLLLNGRAGVERCRYCDTIFFC